MERLAGRAPRDEGPEGFRESVGLVFAARRQEPRGVPSEHVLGEQARAQVGFSRSQSGRAQPIPRVGDELMNAHETAVASFSFSAW